MLPLLSFSLLSLFLAPAKAQRGPLPFNWTTTYADHGIPFQACSDNTARPLFKVSTLEVSGCDSSPCVIHRNSTPTLTLTGRLDSSIPPTTPLKFFAYAWETDIVYWIHGDADFCAMLLPGGGASVCPLPAGEDFKVRFRLPGIAWGYNMDAQLELRVEEPDYQSVVCMGMHMWYRTPTLPSGDEISEINQLNQISDGGEEGDGGENSEVGNNDEGTK